MSLQRYLYQITKQCIMKQCILRSNKQSYCELRQKYSSNVKGRLYSDQHEWVTVENNIGTVGISNYAQESLGDVVFAELPDPGTVINEGFECGAVESVKAVNELCSPVSGVVTEKNRDVENKPALINKSCYDKGWLFKLKLSKPDELKKLMDEAEYEKFLKTNVERDH